MYRGVFTVGVAVTMPVGNNQLNSANAIADYSFITAMSGTSVNALIARCLTGLAPTSTASDANGDLGGLYFNGTMVAKRGQGGGCNSSFPSDVLQVRSGGGIAGLLNIQQCGEFTTEYEGVYTCTMMNSSMMNESVRFGIYLNGRS